jgi:hypothetical protein
MPKNVNGKNRIQRLSFLADMNRMAFMRLHRCEE